jgi:hypothetical protein
MGTRSISGSCHCGTIRFLLAWPDSHREIPVRECGCSFCRKHGGAWTSHRDAELAYRIEDESRISKYRFGTRTADFFVCSVCGVVPFVLSEIDDSQYAVVNVNVFEDVGGLTLSVSSTDFEGEGTGSRLERRKRNWIPRVSRTESVPRQDQ